MVRSVQARRRRCAAHLVVASIFLVVVAACGGGDGGGDAVESTDAPVVVGPPVATVLPFKVMPARVSLEIAGEGVLAPVGAAAPVAWTTSDPAIATVDAAGIVRAVGRGRATITASEGGRSSSASVLVSQSGAAGADPTTEALIDAALASGRIDAEHALVYRVYARFGDDRLPVDLEGGPDARGGVSMRLVSAQLPNLSVATQELLRPFFVPPIYVDSWFGRQLGLSRGVAQPAGKARALQQISCSDLIPSLTRRTTANFTLHALPFDTSLRAIEYLAGQVEDMYARQRGLLQRAAKGDHAEACNGGDGSIDIYVFSFGTRPAETIAYPGRCEDVPAYIVVGLHEVGLAFSGSGFDPTAGPRSIRSLIAHELLHTIQFGMDRQAACADYDWSDEATAQWMMDYLYATDNFEDGLKKSPPGVAARNGEFFADYVLGGHLTPLETPSNAANAGLNGYGDYAFFQFIALKYGAPTIKHLFDAWTAHDSVASLDVALKASGSSLRAAWPEFARAMWNDYPQQVLDELNRWDGYDWGVRRVFDTLSQYARRLQTLNAEQQGAGRASFELLQNLKTAGGFALPPRSMAFERLVFDDDTVSGVLLTNPFPSLQQPEVKLQAVVKIGGRWRAVEDWSADGFKFFCRDKVDERVQEIVLIVSNGDSAPASEAQVIPADRPLLLSTSNIGCWKWQGDATVRHVSPFDGNASAEMTGRAVGVVWQADDPALTVWSLALRPIGGIASGAGAVSTMSTGCNATITAPATPIAPTDALLMVGLDLKSWAPLPHDRRVGTAFGATSILTTSHVVCPGLIQNGSVTTGWQWLGPPVATLRFDVSADGRTIELNHTESAPGAQSVHTFRFTAQRE